MADETTFDVFISHASEDKDSVAIPLAKALQHEGLRVWLDVFELKIGDSLRESIDRGLVGARFAVVILSPSFFAKSWTKAELNALVSRATTDETKYILPVWHKVTAAEVGAFSPLLADRVALTTAQGIETVARQIAEAILIRAEGERQSVVQRLESVVERLERLETAVSPHGVPSAGGHRSPALVLPSKEVFVVHGHDHLVHAVSQFLSRIGLTSVILHERPNAGRTIIEKLEMHASVSYAVVLLTSDDIGALRNQPGQMRSRARQNVVLELGFFLGHLGRDRVCVLYTPGVEIPSDIHGVLYIQLDEAGGWQISLARELRASGLAVDLNRVLT